MVWHFLTLVQKHLHSTAKQTQTLRGDLRAGIEQTRNFSSQHLRMGAAARQQGIPEKPGFVLKGFFSMDSCYLGRNVSISFVLVTFFSPSPKTRESLNNIQDI